VATQTNPSLWWKLSWQLSLVFIVVVATVITGLCVYGAMILSPTVGLKERLSVALEDAVRRDETGKLRINEAPALRSFKTQDDKLWFVVVAKDGAMATYGDVPLDYRGLSQFVHLIKDADIRGAAGSEEVASIDAIPTSVGEVRVMYGGNTSRADTFWVMLEKTYPIYVPLLLVSLPAVFLTVPRIVRNALAGLSIVVRKAPTIDPNRPGSRLPFEGVPKEVTPLILAFNEILERLEEQLQSRKRFLIDAAHELRTPIAIMQTRIECMTPGPESRHLMADVARLGATAEQLLEFERSVQTIDPHEMVDLVEMTRCVVADIAPLAIAAGYEIAFESEPLEFSRLGNSAALSRAINNLIGNAIDHGGNKGLISVVVSIEGSITVSDEGPGIDENLQEHVFEPFYRIAPSSKGAGLGLSLVKQIASNHGGRVSVGNASRGAAFTLWL
jgi:signal transduction histidine kinase